MRRQAGTSPRLASAIFLVVAGVVSGVAAAHGTHHVIMNDARAIVLEFLYTGPSPMLYSAVEVFAPDQDKRPYQTGRTDENGRFAFVPARPGTWRLKVDDGDGHRHQVSVEVAEEQVVAPRPVKSRSSSAP